MHPTESQADPAGRPRVTVAAIVEMDGRFLFVEERDDREKLVINQPAGHVEAGEDLLEAVIRECFEETGWRVRPVHLVGFYLWGRSDRSVSYLRAAIACRPEWHDPDAILDAGIERPLWLTPEELAQRREMHRSPLVSRCVEDYLKGEHYPFSVIKPLYR